MLCPRVCSAAMLACTPVRAVFSDENSTMPAPSLARTPFPSSRHLVDQILRQRGRPAAASGAVDLFARGRPRHDFQELAAPAEHLLRQLPVGPVHAGPLPHPL